MGRSGEPRGLLAAAAALLCLAGAGRAGDDPPGADDAAFYYGAARQSCRVGRREDAASSLRNAIRAGFDDVSRMRRDPDLRGLRDHPVFLAAVAARDAADSRLAAARVDAWRLGHPGDGYRYLADPARRIVYVTSLDEGSQRRLQRMIETHAEILEASPLRGGLRHWLVVVVPSASDAEECFDDPHVDGVYSHRTRQLLVREPQRALRHEFVHALHHDRMDELGQEHAPWVQEGLATLYEECRTSASGGVEHPPNDRDAIVGSLARTGGLLSLSELTALTQAELAREASRAYPELRSLLRFIAAEGKLETWYGLSVERHEVDPSGIRALSEAMGGSLAEIERRWVAWLLRQPAGPAPRNTEPPRAGAG
jgi:hypothetical protein